LEGFPGQLGGQRLQALAGGHIAALADEGAPPGGLAPVVQAKDGGQINPMPAFDLLALLPQGFGLAPISALANVPGLNLNDQGEGLRGGAGRVGRPTSGDSPRRPLAPPSPPAGSGL
jgi:hypothetical protein